VEGIAHAPGRAVREGVAHLIQLARRSERERGPPNLAMNQLAGAGTRHGLDVEQRRRLASAIVAPKTTRQFADLVAGGSGLLCGER
jgi:hypothetical protein